MTRTTCVLADDHLMVADGLARLLSDHLEVLTVVHDGLALVDAVRKLAPDLVVADVSMPKLSGVDAMRLLRDEGCRSKFILITIHPEAELAATALRAGARGYLLKAAAAEELRRATQEVLQGRTYLTPAITGGVLGDLGHVSIGGLERLSARQTEVLRLLAGGKRMKAVADELNISIRTVETHKYEIMHTLEIESTADLVRFAIRHGLIEH